jgi:predicted MarR family transcription regulator
VTNPISSSLKKIFLLSILSGLYQQAARSKAGVLPHGNNASRG